MTREETRDLANSAQIQLRFQHALRSAERSNLKRHRVGAIIFNDNTPISSGWSHWSELRLAAFPLSIHAEMHAVLRASRRIDLVGSTIYIARYSVKSGNIGMSLPCETCQGMLCEANVKKAYYSVSESGSGFIDFGSLDLTKR